MCKELSEMTLEELWELFPIILEEHNSEYVNWYETEKQMIVEYIGNEDLKRINHIGSSAVEGLISKPTVDILLEIDTDTDIEKVKDTIIHNGWVLMSSQEEPYFNISFNKGYTKNGYGEKVYHLHVRFYDNWNELYFRDYLIEHKDVASEYGELKLRLQEKYRNDRDGYTHAKTDYILGYSEKAKEKYGDRYKPSV